MSNAQVYRLLQVPNADLGMMTSDQIQVNGTPMVLGHLPIRVIIGQDSYQLAPVTYLLPALSPTPQTSKSSQRKRTTEPQNKPYIKKPPNAFMLFMKEQRPIMQAQILNAGAVPKDSATVNKILGQKWKSLTAGEQKKYFDESEQLSQIHTNMYPDWSYRENYGKKKKRVWSRQGTSSNYLTSTSAPEVPVQAPMPRTHTA
ncbi:transcription factor 7-like 1-C [Festucalex cinctus]